MTSPKERVQPCPKCSAPATVHSTRRTRSGAAIPIPATSSVTSLGPSATNNPAAFRPFFCPRASGSSVFRLWSTFLSSIMRTCPDHTAPIGGRKHIRHKCNKTRKTTAPPESPQVEYRHSDPPVRQSSKLSANQTPVPLLFTRFCMRILPYTTAIHPRSSSGYGTIFEKNSRAICKTKTTAYLCISRNYSEKKTVSASGINT